MFSSIMGDIFSFSDQKKTKPHQKATNNTRPPVSTNSKADSDFEANIKRKFALKKAPIKTTNEFISKKNQNASTSNASQSKESLLPADTKGNSFAKAFAKNVKKQKEKVPPQSASSNTASSSSSNASSASSFGANLARNWQK